VAAINNARAGEHLDPLRLPGDFYQLDPAQQQFVLINLERTDRGLPPVRLDATLSRIAQNYSKQMRDLRFFAHTSPIAGSFNERVESNPSLSGHYALAAENLAGNPVPGAGAMYEYMYDDGAESCGHRANILDPHVTQVGIGWVPGSIYGSISAQEFIASAPWNPYQGDLSAPQPPRVSIVTQMCASSSHADSPIHPLSLQEDPPGLGGQTSYRINGLAPNLVSFHAQIQPNAGNVRITWFLDRVGNLPFNGADISLDVSALAPGKHTLLVYVVDGEQNYALASFLLDV
jgi:Cysteine-rich secretory protein family